MSRYDDDYDDENEDERDEDEVDDEDGVRGSTSNPFSKPSSVRGAGLPQPQRPPTPQGGGSVPSPIRSPGANPNQGSGGGNNSLFPNRPGGGGNNPQQGGGGSNSPQPFNRQSPITRSPGGGSDDKKDDPNDRSAAVNKVLGSFGTKLGGDDKKDEKPSGGGGLGGFGARPGGGSSGGGDRPSSGGSNPFGSGNRPNNPSNDRQQDDKSSGSGGGGLGGLTRGLGGVTSRIGGDDKKDEKPSGGGLGGFGNRLGGNNDKKDEKPAGGGGLGGLGSRVGLGGNNDKKDEKPAGGGGGLGGLGSRVGLGGGDKKDDKSAGGGGGLGGLGSRIGLGGGDKKDDKPSGGLGGGLGGLGSRVGLGGGDKKDSKPAGGGLGGGLGGLGSRVGLGGGDKKDNKSSGGGIGGLSKGLGGLTSRFGGGGDKKDEKPAASGTGGGAFGANRPGSSGAGQSPLGSSLGGGNRPQASGAAPGAAGGRSAFGGGATATPAKGGGKAAAGQPLGDRLKGMFSNPFTPNKNAKPAARAKASKAPKVDQGGLSLDNKLDIIGVSLLLGSLVLLLSSLSPTKGALTESINHGLSYAFGWGAVFVLGVTFAIGVWLILRHFGDEAPLISRTRLIGIGLLFISALVLAQFIYSFQYQVGANQDYLGTLKNVFLPITFNLGRGGGWIGGQIYFLLLSNFGEIGGFLIVFIPVIVGLMLTLSLSASDLAMVLVSNGRNLRDVIAQRRQRSAALRASKQQALAAVAQQISVAKPVDQLPVPVMSSPALPALTPAPAVAEEQRRIPITTGGRTSSVPFRAPDLAGTMDDEDEELAQPIAIPVPVPVAAEKSGGLFSRVRTALPGTKSPESVPAAKPIPAASEKTADKPAPLSPAAVGAVAGAVAGAAAATGLGAIRGRFFGSSDKKDDKPATPTANPGTPGTTPAAASITSPLMPQPQMQQASPVSATQAPQATPLTPTSPVQQPAAFQAPAAATPTASPAEQTPRLGDLLGRPRTPQPSAPGQSPVQQPPTNTPLTPAAGGVQPFSRSPLSRPDLSGAGDRRPTENPSSPLQGNGGVTGADRPRPFGQSAQSPTQQPTREQPMQPAAFQPTTSTSPTAPSAQPPTATPTPIAAAPATPAASAANTPMPDLQSRMQSLRQTSEAPAVQPVPQVPVSQAAMPKIGVEPATAPPTMPAPARAAASSAFAKPNDPPFAIPSSPSASSTSGMPSHLRPNALADLTPPPPPRRGPRNWKMPESAGLLTSGIDEEPDHEMLLKRAHIIEETLASFGAPGRVVDVRTGPVVTQFGVEPDYVDGRGGKKNRVKVGAIAALDKDLQLALGAKAIRIEAPVPGKGYVGVEVPNEKAEVVHLRNVLESAEFKKIAGKSPLAIALGQGVDGTPVAGDLASMPHLLIAGTTGSGKSVCVNAIIASILLNNTPKQVKFVMVDPKRVELTQYNGIPHLIAPVVVELERIVSVLKWVTREMDERYRKFSNAASRNIEDYNKHLPATEEAMPYIVVIIDELADLMMLAPDDTERVITRIAALARATGIHLVIATQRPSVDVVTGLIKANFPARIAFAVAGNTDSRVILDQPGAERLLGRGDMLWMSGDSPAPVRLQGVFVSDNEIGNITRFWRGQMSEDDLIAASRPIGVAPEDRDRSEGGGVIMRNSSNGGTPPRSSNSAPQSQVAFWDKDDDDEGDDDDDDVPDGEDEMYEQAVDLVRRLNKASVSLLQRRLRIGYTRAARMIDTMEERGVVGPATEGSKPREVLPIR